MSSCVFCRIVAKEIPAAVVYEDDQTLAFMDAGQVNPGHVLVAANGQVWDFDPGITQDQIDGNWRPDVTAITHESTDPLRTYTLAGADQAVTPQVIPKYSIDPNFVPDLFLGSPAAESAGGTA